MGDREAAAAAIAWNLSFLRANCRNNLQRCLWFGRKPKFMGESVAQKDEMRCRHMLNAASYHDRFYAISSYCTIYVGPAPNLEVRKLKAPYPTPLLTNRPTSFHGQDPSGDCV